MVMFLMKLFQVKVLNIRLSLYKLIFTFSLLYSPYTIAQNVKTESEMMLLINQTYNRETDSPNDSLKNIEPLLKVIDDNHWQQAKIEALLLKAELLSYLNKLKSTDAILQYISKNLSHHIDLNRSIRMNLLHIETLNNDVQVEDILNFHTLLLKQAQDVDVPVLKAKIYLSIGASLQLLGLYDGAIEQLTKGYQIYQKIHNRYGEIDALNSLANVYTELQDYEVAINYHSEAYRFVQENNNFYGMSILEYNIGGNYLKIERYTEAMNYFNRAKVSGSKASFVAIGAFSNHRLAEIYIREEEWQSAIELLLQAEQFYIETNDKIYQFDVINSIIKAYTGLTDFSNAQNYLIKSEVLLTQLGLPKRQIRHNDVAAKLAYAMKNYRSAFDIMEKNIALTEQKYAKQQEQEVNKLKIKFDTELIESQNVALLKNNKLNTAIISEQKNKMRVWGIVAVLASFLIFSIALALKYKVRDRNRFKQLAMTDPLTESPNRRAVLEFAAEKFKHAQLNSEFKLALGIIDLDRFKQLNDTYGHDVGDSVLKHFAATSRDVMLRSDKFGRFGGEEWLFIFCNPTESHIQHIFERIHKNINALTINGIPENYDITFSMGTAFYDPNVDENLREFISRADKMMYQAKQNGRNRLVMNRDNKSETLS